MQTILIVEDNENIAEGVRAYLENEGYKAIVAADGEAALQLFSTESFDLVVLDLMLPKVDGLEVCRRIRSKSEVPVIMLTAKVEETDRLVGLELGADDYVGKPFSVRELVARIRAVLRRVNRTGSVARAHIEHGPLTIDTERHEASCGGARLDLTHSEFVLLSLLASHPGRVFSRARLVEELHGTSYDGYERTIDMHVANLRKKLRGAGAEGLIQTVIGAGYKIGVSGVA
ncbi:MAG: DNA-binding response regulator [Actinobacteria bacterium]|nr:MAG: DNA-binding response regulator [Actinomycetota bacterium]